MCDLQNTNHQEKNLFDNKISCKHILLYIVNKHQCNMFTMCSFFHKLFTAAGNNNTMYSKNKIGNRKFHPKLPIIVFQINSISLIESEESKESLIVLIERIMLFAAG